MCEFCGTEDERRQAATTALYVANRAEKVARHYRDLAHGTIKPHTDEMKRIEVVARALIRDLVDDWV